MGRTDGAKLVWTVKGMKDLAFDLEHLPGSVGYKTRHGLPGHGPSEAAIRAAKPLIDAGKTGVFPIEPGLTIEIKGLEAEDEVIILEGAAAAAA